jgi:photosystem II stability/assembly factor-like uncharacterized protein
MPRLLLATLGRGLLRSDDLGRSWSTEPGLPEASRLHALSAGPGELLVGGDGRVYRYSERTWSEMPLPPGSGEVSALAVLDSAILAGTTPLGLLRSADGGRTWERLDFPPVPSTPERRPRFTALLPSAAVAQEVWAAAEVGGVFASSDAGRTWSGASDGMASLDVHALAWSSGGVLVASTPAGVVTWRSARWVAGQFEGPDRYCRGLAVRPDHPGTLFCGFGDRPGGARGGIGVSTDGGRSWRAAALAPAPGEPIWSIAVSADAPAFVFACSLAGQSYVSDDGVESWRAAAGVRAEVRAIACMPE